MLAESKLPINSSLTAQELAEEEEEEVVANIDSIELRMIYFSCLLLWLLRFKP
jgi:hypothetical protein